MADVVVRYKSQMEINLKVSSKIITIKKQEMRKHILN